MSGDEMASLDKPVSAAYERKLKHAYYASVSYVDAQVGKVLDELNRLGLAENTIVVVWGDNGWHLGDQRIWGKHTIFERALKTPLIIKLPGKSQKNGHVDQVVSSIDIYPTLMDLCGVEMPLKTDGRSLVRLIKKPGLHHWEGASYGYFMNGISLRTDRYRLSKFFRKEEPVLELYDHKNDPFENNNIAGERKDVVKSLMPLLEKGNTGLFGK